MRILLLSGGADSMLLKQEFKFDKLVFFDYGQKHLEEEFDCCKKYVTDYFRIGLLKERGKEVNCRNLLFINYVVSKFGNEDLEIYLGMNSEDIYKDNSRTFYNELEVFINKISFNKVSIVTPLKNMSKQDILAILKLNYYTD